MLNKIFSGQYLQRLDNTIQWQEKDTLTKDSVSSHSFKVTVFARILLEDVFGNINSEKVIDFKLEVVTAALFHDFDEALLMRDISHELKYNDYNGDKIRAVLNDYVKHRATSEFLENVNNNNANYKASARMVVDAVTNNNVTVKLFVKYCDWLALLFYCKREIGLNNNQFEDIYDYCEENVLKTGQKLRESLIEYFPYTKMELNCIETEKE